MTLPSASPAALAPDPSPVAATPSPATAVSPRRRWPRFGLPAELAELLAEPLARRLFAGGWAFFGVLVIVQQLYAGRARPFAWERLGRQVLWTGWEVGFWVLLCLLAFAVAWSVPLERLRGRAAVGANLLAAAAVAGAVGLDTVARCMVLARGVCPEPLPIHVLNSFSGTAAVFYALLALGYGLQHARRHRGHEIAASRLEAQLADARLGVLEAQLHPHFLFNTFNSVAALIPRDPAGAEEMLDRLVGLLSRTLRRAGAHEVPLAEELAFVEAYAGIEKVRFSDRLRVDVSVEPGVERARVPFLLLQPLVENAIRHGVATRPGPGRIEVCARAVNGRLLLSVSDDGPGPAATSPHAGQGVGLANTRARLAQLYGPEHAVELSAGAAGGLTVALSLPLRGDPARPPETPGGKHP